MYSHERGIIHHHLKSTNIIFGEHGEVWVLDWGLARPWNKDDRACLTPSTYDEYLDLQEINQIHGSDDPASHLNEANTINHTWEGWERSIMLTLDGEITGTPHYMDPEQVAGLTEQIEPWSDVYAIGSFFMKL